MRFVVIGEALVDLVQSRTDRTFTAHAGGSPFNVAITMGRLGEDVAFAGRGGDDTFGAMLAGRLADSGVRLDLWRTLARPTSLAVASLDAAGGADYRFYFDGTAGLMLHDAVEMPSGAAVHSGSIASWRAPAADSVAAALQKARADGGALVSYDPNVRGALIDDLAAARDRVEGCVASAHVVKASDEDLALLFPGRTAGAVAARWCEIGALLVVVTHGADGAVAFGPDGELARRTAPPITVADTVGAGDALMGGLLSALNRAGLAHPDALATATRHTRLSDHAGDDVDVWRGVLDSAITVAAMTCERPGADPPNAAELSQRLADTSGT